MRFSLPSEWSVDTVENLMSHIIDYRGKTPKKTDYGIPLVTAKIVKGGRIQPYNEFIAEENYDKWMVRGIPQKGDVVLTVEAPLGEVAQLDDTKIALAQRIVTLRGKQEIISNDYLLYILQSRQMQGSLEARASGTTVIGIKQSELRKVEIPFPPLPTQKKIAHILSTLDDKIELNRKMNQTLEEMAQALFKSWFVDFDPVHAKAGCRSDAELEQAAAALGISKEVLELFPSTFEESEMGMIPEGWEVKPFSEVAVLSTKSIKPHAEPEKLWTHYSIPAFDESSYPVHELGEEIKSNKYAVDEFAILSSKLNPRTERTWLPNIIDETVSICSTEFMQFVPVEPEQRSYVYYLIKSDPFQNEIKSRVTGTTGSRQRAQPKQVAVVNVVSPTDEVIKAFCKITSRTTSKLLANLEEIQTLQETRDTLLPKLLSGELDVSNIEGI